MAPAYSSDRDQTCVPCRLGLTFKNDQGLHACVQTQQCPPGQEETTGPTISTDRQVLCRYLASPFIEVVYELSHNPFQGLLGSVSVLADELLPTRQRDKLRAHPDIGSSVQTLPAARNLFFRWQSMS